MTVLSVLDKFFQSAFVSQDGVIGTILPTDVRAESDGTVGIRGLIGHGATPDATPLSIVLNDFGSVANGDMMAIEAYVTAKSGTTVRRKIKISAIVYGGSGVATIDGTPDIDVKGTGTATAAIVVTGATFALQLTGVAATAITWGWELRRQKL